MTAILRTLLLMYVGSTSQLEKSLGKGDVWAVEETAEWVRRMGEGKKLVAGIPLVREGEAIPPLVGQIMRAFLKGGLVSVSESPETIWWERRVELLEKDHVGGYRNEGPEYLLFGLPHVFWPPPLVKAGPDSSLVWRIEGGDLSGEAMEEMCGWGLKNGLKGAAVFREVSQPQKPSTPKLTSSS